MVCVEKLQAGLWSKGYVFVEDASKLVWKIFCVFIISIILFGIQCVEIKCNVAESPMLLVYPLFAASIIGTCMFIFVLVLGKRDYEVTCLNEALQIHRLCIFLRGHKELNREETIKCIMKITDRYYVTFRSVLLYLVTGREAEWEQLIDNGNRHADTRILSVMWTRIFENIREMDASGELVSGDLLKNQLEYADEVCHKQINRLAHTRIIVCRVIAYLPIFAAVIFYMIYPFVLEGIKLLNMYSEELNALGLQ